MATTTQKDTTVVNPMETLLGKNLLKQKTTVSTEIALKDKDLMLLYFSHILLPKKYHVEFT